MAALCLAARLPAQGFHTYVGQIESHSVLIAWGTTAGEGNTIGRGSVSSGKAHVTVGEKSGDTTKNWIVINELPADASLPYELTIDGTRRAQGTVRTYPDKAQKLRFFVLGDWGNGTPAQYRVADSMWKEFQRYQSTDNPVRFVITTGDNIYADLNLYVSSSHSGDQDNHWESKFFHPYEPLIRQIPFYPTLGNHDGNGSENRGDLPTYLDNFYFPGNHPARWYTFTYGGLAQFFALDSTNNSESGRTDNVFRADGAEFKWFKEQIPASTAPWKIPYWHHPLYNAGPRHPASLNDLRHFADVFQKNGVKVVFSGHEHNFQFTDLNDSTGNIRYVVSGAGGELRTGDVRGKMAKAHIAGWAAEFHFLMVEIEGDTMKIMPISGSDEPVNAVDPDAKKIPMPLVVTR